jgi:hypothetical protein
MLTPRSSSSRTPFSSPSGYPFIRATPTLARHLITQNPSSTRASLWALPYPPCILRHQSRFCSSKSFSGQQGYGHELSRNYGLDYGRIYRMYLLERRSYGGVHGGSGAELWHERRPG